MIWDIIDNLRHEKLKNRALELRGILKALDDDRLVLFDSEVMALFDQLFNGTIYHVYTALFDGETNDMGLVDFCCNLMLGGHSLAEMALTHPDQLVGLVGQAEFNDESGISLTDIARQILIARHGERGAFEKFGPAGPPELGDIWGKLRNEVGTVDFAPDWRIISSLLPSIYAATHR